MKKILPMTGMSENGQIAIGVSPAMRLFCQWVIVPRSPVRPWQKNTMESPAIT